MNKYKILLVTLLASVLFACSEDEFGAWQNLENVQLGSQPHYLNVAEKDVKLDSKANSSAKISVTSINTKWKLDDIPSEWLTASPDKGESSTEVMLKATENMSGYNNRIAVLSLNSLSSGYFFSDKVAVTQSASIPYATPDKNTLITPWQADTMKVNIQSNIEWKAKVSSSANWLSCKKEGNQLFVYVTKNLSEDRSGEIYLTDTNSGKSLSMIKVKQGKVGVESNIDEIDLEVQTSSKTVIIETAADMSDFEVETSESWLSTSMQRLNAQQIELKISALANQSIQPRSGYVYLLLGDSRKVSILVNQKGITFNVEGELKEFKGDGTETNKLKVISDDSWKVYAKPNWLTVDPESGELGETFINLTAKNNASLSPREGILSLGLSNYDFKKDFTVKQSVWSARGDSAVYFHWEAATSTIELSIPTDWQATLSDNWFSIANESGNGKATIEVSVQTNNNEEERRGTITFASEGNQYVTVINVIQEGQYLKIESSSTDIPVEGGDISINVETSVGARDSIHYEGATDWISIEPNMKNGYILHIDKNPSTKDRTAWFYILPTRSTTSEACKSGIKLEIKQPGRKLKVNVNRINFYGKGGTSETYTLEADGTYNISKGENSAWYTVEHNASTHTFYVKATQNPINEKRTDTVTIALTQLPQGETCAHKLVIVQHGKDVDEGDAGKDGFAKPSKNALTYNWKAGKQVVNIDSDVEWEAQVKVGNEWMHLTTTKNDLTISADLNYSEKREGKIAIFNAKTGAELATITVTQEQVEVHCDKQQMELNIHGEKSTATIVSEAPWSDFTSESTVSWLSASFSEGSNNTLLTVTAQPNPSIETRNGEIHVSLGGRERLTLAVSQQAYTISTEGTLSSFDAGGTKSQSLKVISNDKWKVLAKPEWLTVSPDSGKTGKTLLTLKAAKNASIHLRKGALELGAEGFEMKKTVEINQQGLEADVDSLIQFNWEASTQDIKVSIPGAWKASLSAEWMSLPKLSGESTKNIKLSVQTNNGEESREGKITLTSEGKQYVIKVVQGGQYLKAEATSTEMETKGGDISVTVNSSVGARDSISYGEGTKNWISVDRNEENKYLLHVTENNSTKQRTASFYVLPTMKATNATCKEGVKFEIKQQGRKLLVNLSNIKFYGKGGQSEICTVQADGKYTVQKGANSSWYEIHQNTAANTFTIQATANTSTLQRKDTVTIALIDLPKGEICEHQLAIMQYSKNVNEDDDDADGFAKPSVNTIDCGWKKESKNIDIDANVNWKSKVKTGAEWIHLNDTKDHLTISVDQNNAETRSGAVSIMNVEKNTELAVITVNQGKVEVTSNIDNLDFKVNGGTQKVTIESAAAPTDFTAESTVNWLTPSLSKGSSGKTELSITATANSSLTTRNGEVHLMLGTTKRLTISVSQQCLSFTAEGSLETFDAKGTKTNQLTVKSNSEWKVLSKPQWLTVTPASGQAGDFQLSLKATPNSSINQRSEKLEIGLVGFDLKKTFEVKQMGMGASIENHIDFTWEQSQKSTSINLPGAWTAEPSTDWISLSKSAGTGYTDINLSVKSNNSEFQRAGKVTFRSEGKTYEMNILQGGQYLEAKATNNNIGAKGGDINVTVNSTVGAKDSISYIGTPTQWITVNKTETNNFVLQVSQNKSTKARKADFYVKPTKKVTNPTCQAGVKIAIEQPGRQLQVNVSEIFVSKNGGQSKTYTIKADGDYHLNKANGDSWYTVKYDALANTFYLIVEENKTSTTRTGTLTISLGSLPDGEVCKKEIKIVQTSRNIDADLDDFEGNENWNPENM